jgi:hypothetical protein
VVVGVLEDEAHLAALSDSRDTTRPSDLTLVSSPSRNH